MELGMRKRSLETICCICHRKKCKSGWRRAKVKPFADLSHGYCPECYRQTLINYGLASEIEAVFS